MVGRGCSSIRTDPNLRCVCTHACTLTLTGLRSHACLISHRSSLSLVPPALLLPSMVRASVLARCHSGLGVSGPRRGGSSGPRHGSTMAPMALSRPDQHGRAGTSGSMADLALCPRRAALPPCRIVQPPPSAHRQAAASGELHRMTSLHSPKQHGDVTLR
jgi:hypothetical protein